MILFDFNLALAAIGFVVAVALAYANKRLLTPEVVLFGMPILLLLLPATLGDQAVRSRIDFNFVMTVGLLSTAFVVVIRGLATTHCEKKPSPKELPEWFVIIGAIAYGAYLLGSIIARIIEYGGVIAALTVARVQELLGGGILAGRGLELFFQLPQVLYFFAIGTLIDRRRVAMAWTLALLMSVFYVFTANTRLPILFPLVSMLVVLIERARPTLFRLLAPLLGVTAVLMVFLFSVVGNSLRQGTLLDLSGGLNQLLVDTRNQVRDDLGYYNWLEDIYDATTRGDVHVEHGYAWAVLGPMSVIPRVLWPSKPITSTSNRLTEQVYGVSIGDGTPITTFTIYGEGFFQGRYFGVFLAVVLFASLYYFVFHAIGSFAHSQYWRVQILLHMVVFFRAEVPVPDMILWSTFLVLFTVLTNINCAPRQVES